MSFPLFGLKKQKLWGFFGFLGGGDDFASKAPSGRIPEQGRAKRGPRAAKSDPKVRPGSPRTGQGAGQGARRPNMVLRRLHMGAKRAAERPQKRPRGGPAYGSRGHKSREAKARRYK